MDKYVYALGTFDGVHLGHQSLLAAAVQLGQRLGAQPAVYTFSDLPRATLEQRQIGMLTTPGQKYDLLRAAGADRVIAEPFSKIRALTAEQFIYYLVGVYSAEGFVCGWDFRFGRGGEGDVALLRQICQRLGKELQIVDFMQDSHGQKLSSRHIRTYVEQGNMEAATAALGRPFFLEGAVRQGKGLARTWGTPTVNISLPDGLVRPRYGVYATRITVAGQTYLGVTNVGVRPTVNDGDLPNAETYILEGSFAEIEAVTVEFLHFVRPEQTFADEKSLQMQIIKDIQTVREMW